MPYCVFYALHCQLLKPNARRIIRLCLTSTPPFLKTQIRLKSKKSRCNISSRWFFTYTAKSKKSRQLHYRAACFFVVPLNLFQGLAVNSRTTKKHADFTLPRVFIPFSSKAYFFNTLLYIYSVIKYFHNFLKGKCRSGFAWPTFILTICKQLKPPSGASIKLDFYRKSRAFVRIKKSRLLHTVVDSFLWVVPVW